MTTELTLHGGLLSDDLDLQKALLKWEIKRTSNSQELEEPHVLSHFPSIWLITTNYLPLPFRSFRV